MHSFGDAVLKIVNKVPRGRAATYGQIAAMAGHPRAARVVGMILKSLPGGSKVPWHRIINKSGMISIENLAVPKAEQATRLQEEGIEVKFKDGNYWIDLEKYLWRP